MPCAAFPDGCAVRSPCSPSSWPSPRAALLGPSPARRRRRLPALAAPSSRAPSAARRPPPGRYVRDLTTGRPLFAARATHRADPGLGREALHDLDGARAARPVGARCDTTVAGRGFLDPDGVWQGDLYLQGGGDPSLSTLGLAKLADRVAAAGVLRVAGPGPGRRVVRSTAARGGPATRAALRPRHGRRARRADGRPRLRAAGAALRARRPGRSSPRCARRAGIRVVRRRRRGAGRPRARGRWPRCPPPPWPRSCARRSCRRTTSTPRPCSRTSRPRPGRPGTHARPAPRSSAARRPPSAWRPSSSDGSGLSRADRVTPARRRRAPGRDAGSSRPRRPSPPGWRSPGGRARVRLRMRGTAAQDRCRAKTGTLRDVSALAGVCTTAAGHSRRLRVPHEPDGVDLARPPGAGPHGRRAGALRRPLRSPRLAGWPRRSAGRATASSCC